MTSTSRPRRQVVAAIAAAGLVVSGPGGSSRDPAGVGGGSGSAVGDGTPARLNGEPARDSYDRADP